MGNLATKDLYKVVAIAPSGTRRVIAPSVGAFKASRLAAEIKRRGFKVEVVEVYVLKD